MNQLDTLENKSIYILREAYSQLENLCMLWSIGKDRTVLLWLARKTFFGHVPFPLLHIDTSYIIPEMIAYRDRLSKELGVEMLVGRNSRALEEKRTFPDGNATRLDCCGALKTEALVNTINGSWPRWRLNHQTGDYEQDAESAFYGVIVGMRADEEGSRSKERYFSARGRDSHWDVADQPRNSGINSRPILRGTHVRVHPLLDGRVEHLAVYRTGKRSPSSHCILTRATEHATARWAARPAPGQFNPLHPMSARSSKSCAPAR